jgi:hypothetical protein
LCFVVGENSHLESGSGCWSWIGDEDVKEIEKLCLTRPLHVVRWYAFHISAF